MAGGCVLTGLDAARLRICSEETSLFIFRPETQSRLPKGKHLIQFSENRIKGEVYPKILLEKNQKCPVGAGRGFKETG